MQNFQISVRGTDYQSTNLYPVDFVFVQYVLTLMLLTVVLHIIYGHRSIF